MIHAQEQKPEGWTESLPLLPDGALIKLVGDVQAAREVKGINPALKVLYRHVNNEGYVWSDDWAANVAQAELEYRRYIDGSFADLAEDVDLVEEPRNEYVDNGMNEAQIARRVMWARACAYVWETVFRPQFPHIRCAIGSQPVGNDVPMGFFKACHDFDAVLSTHAYVHFTERDVRDPLDFRYHSGRWAHDDEQARALGYEVDIAITETGPYDGSTWNGWRASNVLGGDVDGYVEAMRAVIRDWMQTHAAQTGRLLGFNLFTTNRTGWDLYLTNQPELNALAEMTAQEWQPGSDPPPPPPEEPVNATGIDVSHWQGQMDWQQAADAGAQFAFVKATDGAEWVDPRLAENVAGAQAAGIPIGLYHYYRPAVHPVVQAHLFRRHWRKYDTELPPVVDLEETDGIDDAFISVREDVHYILLLIEWLTGRRPLIYTSAGWWDSHIRRAWYARYYDLWAAHWTDAEEPLLPGSWDEWTFWQHSSDGNGAAYGAESDRIDLNRYNGTVDELLARYVDPPQPESVIWERDYNLRRAPEITEFARIETMPAGWEMDYAGTVTGQEYDGSDTWYAVAAYVHSGGVRLDGPGEQTGFHFAVWPTDERRVTQRFGANPDYYQQFGLPGHEGIDLAAPMGSPIRAVYPGHVYRATGDEGNYGIQVRIDHGDGYRTVYAHLQELRCAVGDVVEAGDVIGLADSTGNSTGSHLHLTVKHEGNGEPGYGGDIIDPSPFAEEHEPEWP